MRWTRTRAALAGAAAALAAVAAAVPAGAATGSSPVGATTGTTAAEGWAGSYVVVADGTGTVDAARRAVAAAGGTVISVDRELALLTATAADTGFVTRATAGDGVYAVARNDVIGSLSGSDGSGATAGSAGGAAAVATTATAADDADGSAGTGTATGTASADPDDSTGTDGATLTATEQPADVADLTDLQWDMDAIGAPEAHEVTSGDRRVVVAVLDTGIDGSHPDLVDAFDASASYNFVTDIPALDGPCAEADCVDPVDTDPIGHGTHIAGTIAAADDGTGITGVAPGVTVVSYRVAHDTGDYFLGPVVEALRTAADNGVDVVNMSFFVDPWLYNCTANPADSAAEQIEQRATITAMQRALGYAHRQGVTLVAGLGNTADDLDDPGTDDTSPNGIKDTVRDRSLDASSCLTLPAQGSYVLGVSATGPSGTKAAYSTYGYEDTDLAAPGGFKEDLGGSDEPVEDEVLSPLPHDLVMDSVDSGVVSATTGRSLDPRLVAYCTGATADTCSYWGYLEGTSMATPHVAGVAALVVSRYGTPDGDGGLTLSPDRVGALLRGTATEVACPAVTVTYEQEGLGAEYDATCTGTAERNSLHGYGLVDAAAALGT